MLSHCCYVQLLKYLGTCVSYRSASVSYKSGHIFLWGEGDWSWDYLRCHSWRRRLGALTISVTPAWASLTLETSVGHETWEVWKNKSKINIIHNAKVSALSLSLCVLLQWVTLAFNCCFPRQDPMDSLFNLQSKSYHQSRFKISIAHYINSGTFKGDYDYVVHFSELGSSCQNSQIHYWHLLQYASPRNTL